MHPEPHPLLYSTVWSPSHSRTHHQPRMSSVYSTWNGMELSPGTWLDYNSINKHTLWCLPNTMNYNSRLNSTRQPQLCNHTSCMFHMWTCMLVLWSMFYLFFTSLHAQMTKKIQLLSCLDKTPRLMTPCM